MDDDFVEKLRIVGLAHVVVASGFHLAIFVGLARRLGGKISRFAALWLACFLVVTYVALVGLSASLLRAAIVTFFSLFSWYFGRHLHPFRVILYVAVLTLAIDPTFLTNVAWLLSFSSYFGIVIIAPIIKTYLYGSQKPPAISESIIITISAQLACLPISLYFFGGFSILGVLANLIISPSIAAVMFLTLMAGSTALSLFAQLAKIILAFHVYVVELLSAWGWGYLALEPNNPIVFLLYAPILALVFLAAIRGKHRFRPAPLLEKYPKNGKIYTC